MNRIRRWDNRGTHSAARQASVNGSRRVFLHGLLAGCLGVPWLEAFHPTRGNAQSPRSPRFVAMFSANGTVFDQWAPKGEKEDFTLSPILSPLAPHQSDLVVVEGLTQQGAGGDGHQNGIGGMLTGSPLLPGRFGGQFGTPAGWSEGPSIDQAIAERISQAMPFRSLELGVQTGAADNWARMCYRGRNQPLTPREDPARVFDDVFGFALLDPSERERRVRRSTSVLDYVRTEFEQLSGSLGASDRQRLELHLTHLRDVERRLQEQSEVSSQCSLPERPGAVDRVNDAFPETGELMMDLLASALACGRTNVASLQWSRSTSPVRFSWLGIEEEHHQLSHLPDEDEGAQAKLTQINSWYAARFGGLVERLKRYDEGEGSLFDQCLMLWANELGKGNVHSREKAPYVLAGSAGAALATGRYLRYPEGTPHNNLLVSLLRVMGFDADTFGKPEWCTGPLDGFSV